MSYVLQSGEIAHRIHYWLLLPVKCSNTVWAFCQFVYQLCTQAQWPWPSLVIVSVRLRWSVSIFIMQTESRLSDSWKWISLCTIKRTETSVKELITVTLPTGRSVYDHSLCFLFMWFSSSILNHFETLRFSWQQVIICHNWIYQFRGGDKSFS